MAAAAILKIEKIAISPQPLDTVTGMLMVPINHF